jgi:hypothetical protein
MVLIFFSLGLIRSGIMMSGSVLIPPGLLPKGRPVAERIAGSLDCPVTSSKLMKECFRVRGAKELVRAIAQFEVSNCLCPSLRTEHAVSLRNVKTVLSSPRTLEESSG